MDWLNEIAKHHKAWLKAAKAYGLKDQSEDAVQDLYLKLHKYNGQEKAFKNGVLQKGYVFIVLKSIVYTYHKKNEKNKEKYEIKDVHHYCELDMEEHLAWENICSLVEEEQEDWELWENNIFELYKHTGESYRALSDYYNISFVSIWKIITELKERIYSNAKIKKAYQKEVRQGR